MNIKEKILTHLRDKSPALPPLSDFNPLFGYAIILTSIPTVNEGGDEGEGGNGCSTTAKAATAIGRQKKMRMADPIFQGDRMRALSHKLQARSKIDRTKNDERRYAESILELQRTEGRREDQRAFREVVEAVMRGENIILEAKFGALLLGWLAEFAPMIPISVIGLDCEDGEATARKRDVTQTKEKRYVTLEETAEDRIKRVQNDNDAIQKMYGAEFPGIEFSRAKQLSVVTDVIVTSDALVEEPANVILEIILERTAQLRKEYLRKHPVQYGIISAMELLGIEDKLRKALPIYRKLQTKLRNLFPNTDKLNVAQ